MDEKSLWALGRPATNALLQCLQMPSSFVSSVIIKLTYQPKTRVQKGGQREKLDHKQTGAEKSI